MDRTSPNLVRTQCSHRDVARELYILHISLFRNEGSSDSIVVKNRGQISHFLTL